MVRLGYLDGTVDTLDSAGRYFEDEGFRLNIDIDFFSSSIPLHCDSGACTAVRSCNAHWCKWKVRRP